MAQLLWLKLSTSELREGFFGSFILPSLSLPDGMSTSERKGLQDTERVEARPGYDEKDVTAVYNAHVDVSDVDEAKLIRKIDWRLLPWLSFLYLLSFLDRTSIGNAKVR